MTKISSDKSQAIDWARQLLANPKTRFLDTETTGFRCAYLVEICILSRYGSPMLNTLVKPPIPISPDATRIHNISNESVATAPEFPDIYPRLKELLEEQTTCIYNAKFDTEILNNCCDYYGLPRLRLHTTCAMLWYAQFVGQWNNYFGNYKGQKLPGCSHRAYGDTRACYDLVLTMAKYQEPISLPKDQLFPPRQIACRWHPWLELRLVKECQQLFAIAIPEFYWLSEKLDQDELDEIPF